MFIRFFLYFSWLLLDIVYMKIKRYNISHFGWQLNIPKLDFKWLCHLWVSFETERYVFPGMVRSFSRRHTCTMWHAGTLDITSLCISTCSTWQGRVIKLHSSAYWHFYHRFCCCFFPHSNITTTCHSAAFFTPSSLWPLIKSAHLRWVCTLTVLGSRQQATVLAFWVTVTW